VADRLEVYHEQTKPLIEFYAARGLLVHVDGNQTVEPIVAEIREKIGV